MKINYTGLFKVLGEANRIISHNSETSPFMHQRLNYF